MFVIGGADDLHTTEGDTRMLYDAARGPKQMWLLPRAGHVDFHEVARDEYRARVLKFLSAAFAETRSPSGG